MAGRNHARDGRERPASRQPSARWPSCFDPLAAALAEAHRLGLAHGRLGPDQVFLTATGGVKLDFSGASVGFPPAAKPERAPDAIGVERGAPETWPSFGRPTCTASEQLIAWLDCKTGDEPRAHASRVTDAGRFAARQGSRASSWPKTRPSDPPRMRCSRGSTRLSRPMDATGDWSEPDDRSPRGRNVGPRHRRSRRRSPARSRPRSPDGRDEAELPLGRYRLLEKLGEGGQGVVYRASTRPTQTVVAIKVLRSDRAENAVVLRRFRKEARLMAEANNPHVVNLLEYNEDDGIPYLVLEFVAGASLGQLLEEKSRLDVPEALSIMAGVARGLIAGARARNRSPRHQAQQHPASRRMSPEARSRSPKRSIRRTARRNDQPTRPAAARNRSSGRRPMGSQRRSIDSQNGDSRAPRVKITDFGLARHVVDSESLAMTDAGALLGTPHYMAPEQWTGRGVDPRTDVYAMGATLYHLLAGQPPFTGETRDLLCEQHCNDQPPSLALLNPSVSEGVARAVERALSKSPDDRFPDAAAMLRDLEALRLGQTDRPGDSSQAARLRPGRVLQFEFRWELESSPRQLWPLVTNTDRLDRALGFSPVTYQTRFEPGRGVRTFAEGRKAGMPEVGEEFPYEWVEPRRMGILREYTQGPFKWLVSSVELLPRPGGGTTLDPLACGSSRATWTIRLGIALGGGRRHAEEPRESLSPHRCDPERPARARAFSRSRSVRGAGPDAGAAAPAAGPPDGPAGRARRGCRGRRPPGRAPRRRIGPGGGPHPAAGPGRAIRARSRPGRRRLSARRARGPARAALGPALPGLPDLCQVTDTLREIAEHAHCEACHLDFELDFANSIELIFRVHPEIREADLGTYCIGGPAHSPHVVAQMRVAPRERIELELELPEGSYRLRGPQLPWSADFRVEKTASARRWDIDLAAGPVGRPAVGFAGRRQMLVLHNTGESRALDSRRANCAAARCARPRPAPPRCRSFASCSRARSSPPAGSPRFRV